jgi:hypothetical protein
MCVCAGASLYDLHVYRCDCMSSEIELYPAIPKCLPDWYEGFLCVWLLEPDVYAPLINIERVKFPEWGSSRAELLAGCLAVHP